MPRWRVHLCPAGSVSRGYDKIVQMLLDKATNANAQDAKYSNALYAASVRCHGPIVNMLSDKGADGIARYWQYRNALRRASVRGYDTSALS